jgi:hypothetical protein
MFIYIYIFFKYVFHALMLLVFWMPSKQASWPHDLAFISPKMIKGGGEDDEAHLALQIWHL